MFNDSYTTGRPVHNTVEFFLIRARKELILEIPQKLK